MAMVVSGRAKAVIGAFICFFLLGIVLVTGSTKGWFVPVRYNHERVAARIQVRHGVFFPSQLIPTNMVPGKFLVRKTNKEMY